MYVTSQDSERSFVVLIFFHVILINKQKIINVHRFAYPQKTAYYYNNEQHNYVQYNTSQWMIVISWCSADKVEFVR
jgi:hypothetical protein